MQQHHANAQTQNRCDDFFVTWDSFVKTNLQHKSLYLADSINTIQ